MEEETPCHPSPAARHKASQRALAHLTMLRFTGCARPEDLFENMKLWGCGFIILSIAALVLSGDGGGEEYMSYYYYCRGKLLLMMVTSEPTQPWG